MKRIVACGVLLIAAGCSSSTEPSGNSPVSITDAGFAPDTIVIALDRSVRWTNNGTLAHRVVADSGEFSSGTLGAPYTNSYGNPVSGTSFEFHFTSPGYFEYHCAIHPAMVGTVYVQFPPD